MSQVVGPTFVKEGGRDIGASIHACPGEVFCVKSKRTPLNAYLFIVAIEIRVLWADFHTGVVKRVYVRILIVLAVIHTSHIERVSILALRTLFHAQVQI